MVLLLAAFTSLVWTPHPVARGDLMAQLLDPGPNFLLGTDAQGRDLLSLALKALLTSFVVAGIGIALALFIGVPLGLAALRPGYAAVLVEGLGGFLALIPGLATAAVLAVLAGPGAASAMVAIGLAGIPGFARLTRAAATLGTSGTLAAARIAGLSRWDAALRHALPALRLLLVSRAATAMGFAVIAEAALAYAGLAAQPGGMSFGLMLREAQAYLTAKPALVLVPGLAVTLLALLFHYVGERLGARLEPPLAALEASDGAA
jgi:peptide/nickel transport system permease protein